MAKIRNALARTASIPASGKFKTSAIEVYRARTLTATVRVKFNASATSGARLNVYTSPDGKNWDTEAYAQGNITVDAGETEQKTFTIDSPEAGNVVYEVENLDSTYTLTDVAVWFTIERDELGPEKLSKEELEEEQEAV